MKEIIRKGFGAAMLLVMTLVFTSCEGALDDIFGEWDNPASGAAASGAVTSITLDETKLTKNLGDAAVKLTATVAPENAVDKSITWRSDNPAVATVNNGEVSIIGLGTAIITAAANDGSGVKATCTVTVLFPGLLAGKFSVSGTQQVQFSQGNLQAVVESGPTNTYNYTASSWKFAEHQWDYIGDAAGNTTFDSGTTVDLFGFVGNSATFDTYGLCIQNDYSNTSDGSDFAKCYGNVGGENLKSDWGAVTITNGGNTPNFGWRTLNIYEWDYLFSTRTTTSSIRYAKAIVNSVNGVILLPDDWSTSYHVLASTDTKTAAYTTNTITAAEWISDFETHGAVFLPAAGYRAGNSVSDANSNGYYWSSSGYSPVYAFQESFKGDNLYSGVACQRNYGCSVRLVRDVE